MILERINVTHVKVPSMSLAHSRHSKNQVIFFDGKDQASPIFTHAGMSGPAPYPHEVFNKYLRNEEEKEGRARQAEREERKVRAGAKPYLNSGVIA